MHNIHPQNSTAQQSIQLYMMCSGPFQTILHFPYDGPLMDQPAKLVSLFQLIQTILAEKQENESEDEPHVTEAQKFAQRERASNRGNFS